MKIENAGEKSVRLEMEDTIHLHIVGKFNRVLTIQEINGHFTIIKDGEVILIGKHLIRDQSFNYWKIGIIIFLVLVAAGNLFILYLIFKI